ncbi:MAG: hypothetical protein ACXWUG_21630 [Polyangiales bacterium]
MDLFDIPTASRIDALRALKSVALANGRFDDPERAMLRAAAGAYRCDVELDALEAIEPEKLAASVQDASAREHVIQACMLMSLSDQEVSAKEVELLERYAAAFGVEERRLSVMRDLAHGHLRRARFHMIASSRAGLRAQTNDAKLSEILRTAGVLPPNQLLAQRCRALEALPDGTLGREYVRYLQTNGFSWPGEKGGTPEGVMHHDLTHVLTGYTTAPLGEIQIGAFTAGMKKVDPFLFLLFPMLEFHLGLALRPFEPAYPGHYDAKLAFAAHQAGARCKRDLTDHWDFWADVERPVTELRAQLGIET